MQRMLFIINLILRQIIFKMKFNKCSNSAGQRQENDELEESVDSESHNEVEAADGNVEK